MNLPAPGAALPPDLQARFAPLDVVADRLSRSVGADGTFLRDSLTPGRWSCEVELTLPE
jgi:hypothetical protein